MLSTHPNFSFREVVGWHPKFLSSLCMLLWFAMPGLSPVNFQRIVMARDPRQAKHAFTYAAIISSLGGIFLVWLGILLLSIDATLEPEKNRVWQTLAIIIIS